MQYATKFRQDLSVFAMAYYRPNRDLRFRGRIRYYDEAIDDNTYLERSVSALAEAAMRARERDLFRIRLEGKRYIDRRMSTTLRVPNPGLFDLDGVSLWLFYEAKL